MGALVFIGILILTLVSSINGKPIPFVVGKYGEFSSWSVVIPVVFTCFGFHVVFHTLSNYCNRNKKVLNKVFSWGSLIPAIVYIIWSYVILCAIYTSDLDFYASIVDGKVDIGELIKTLGMIFGLKTIQVMVWIISFLAIAT
jgi:tyrosine-specific transport protein